MYLPGCYHSSSTISSLHYLQKASQVTIKRYSFSEPQNGKSSCDRIAALLKRKVHDYVDSGNDVTTAEEFFRSLTNKDKIQGVSVYHGKIIKAKTSQGKIATITKINDFLLEKDGLRFHLYYGIGTGSKISMLQIAPNKGQFEVILEAGIDAGGYKGNVEFHKVENGEYSSYWHTTICKSGKKCVPEPEQMETEDADDDEVRINYSLFLI